MAQIYLTYYRYDKNLRYFRNLWEMYQTVSMKRCSVRLKMMTAKNMVAQRTQKL